MFSSLTFVYFGNFFAIVVLAGILALLIGCTLCMYAILRIPRDKEKLIFSI